MPQCVQATAAVVLIIIGGWTGNVLGGTVRQSCCMELGNLVARLRMYDPVLANAPMISVAADPSWRCDEVPCSQGETRRVSVLSWQTRGLECSMSYLTQAFGRCTRDSNRCRSRVP
jgi:hypothetical protein